MKKVISDRILLELLFQRLRGLDPDADKIIEYWKDDCSISDREIAKRLGRNTLDRLKYIRQLKDMNIPVLFEKESINTMDAKGEVLITIMASLAQHESQSLSQNVKMGLQYRYQQGKVQINHNRFLGYTKDAEGNLVIDPEQAEIVKRIYREYLKGLSMDKIAAGWSVTVFLPVPEEKSGTQAPSTKFSVTRSTSAMPCSKRPTPPTFFTKPELKITVLFHNTM